MGPSQLYPSRAVREDRPVVDLVRLELPEPTSVNALFANVSATRRIAAAKVGRKLPGRTKTVEYLTWLNAAGWAINGTQPRPGRIAGAYEMTIEVSPASGADIGNLLKGTEDLCVTHGLVRDDADADRLVIERNADVPAKEIRVTIRPRWRA